MGVISLFSNNNMAAMTSLGNILKSTTKTRLGRNKENTTEWNNIIEWLIKQRGYERLF